MPSRDREINTEARNVIRERADACDICMWYGIDGQRHIALISWTHMHSKSNTSLIIVGKNFDARDRSILYAATYELIANEQLTQS